MAGTKNRGGERLERAIERRKWTHARAEQALGVSTGLVSRLISGERKPGRGLALRLRELFAIAMTSWDDATTADGERRRTGTEG